MTLPVRVQAGYGVAELGINSVEVLIRVGLLIFYTDVVGLAPELAGYAVALGVIWDALTDPLMGRLSDRTRGRFGRRRPYIALGAVLLAAAIVVLFSPPQADSQAGKFLVLLVSYVFANTAMTIIAVPHSALAGDLASEGHVRARLFGWRLLFANVGLVLGTALPGLLVAGTPEPGQAEGNAAGVVAAVTLVTALLALVATRGRDRPEPAVRAGPGYFASLVALARNRCFWPLFAGYVVASIGLNVNATTALYYYRYRLELDESATRLIIALFMLVFCLSIPLWVMLARRVGPRVPLLAGAASLGVMNCVVYVLFPAGNPWWPLTASVIGGLAIGCVVLLEVMLADVVDHDRVHSGESRFGLYFGVWKMGAKFSRALAIALTGNLLAWIGFVPNTAQGADTAFALALLFGPGVGVFFIAAAALLALHPLDAPALARVHRILELRNARAALAGG